MESSTIRVEMPIQDKSPVLSRFRTIGDLKKEFSNLKFCKYIFLDPKDEQIKGANPPNELPLVPNAYITVIGEFGEVIKFSKELVSVN